MSKQPTKIALLGLGRAGGFHLQSLQLIDGARVATVYDIDQEKAASIAQQHNCAAARTAEEAIESADTDAVIVATPTDSHNGYVLHALESGKPVMTEKPLGRHLHEIDACFQKSQSSDTPLFVAFQRRFDPAFASLVKSVRTGDVGELQFVRSVSRDNPVPPASYIRISGGIFHDCMVHDLDMVCHIVGEFPTHLSAFGSSFIPAIGECEDYDNVVATLSFASGVQASIDINRKSVYGYDQRIEAFGDGGMLQAENYHNTSVTRAGEHGFTRPPVDYSFPTRYRDAYRLEVECFVRCARREEEVPITYEDVRNNHLLASALEVAAKEKRVITFQDFAGV